MKTILYQGSELVLISFRPYEVIAVATHKGISIWRLGLNPNSDGRLSMEKVAQLSGHKGEVSIRY